METVEIMDAGPKEIKARDYMPITDSENIEKFVTDYFVDIPIMAKVAKCESTYRHVNENGVVRRGKVNKHDIGVMQINELYHGDTAKEMGLNIYSLEGNVKYARYLYEKQGVKPWKSSSPCWGKYVGTELAKR